MISHRRLASQRVPSNSIPAAVLLFSVMLMNASIAHADVIFNVNTVADQIDLDVSDGICQTSTGACSLRAAIMQANHLTGPITTRIRLQAGTYVLTRPAAAPDGEENGDLNLTAPLSAGQVIVIEGVTAASSVINANQIDRVMSIAAGRVATLSRITVRGGYTDNRQGGGIFSHGAVTLLDSIIEANTSFDGGGGIHSDGTMDIRRSIIRSNAGELGGALLVSGAMIIRESSLYGNAATFGGAIFVASNAGVTSALYVVNSTIGNNVADADGGGIESQGNTFLYNTSIVGNDADHDRDAVLGGNGGGVHVSVVGHLVAFNSLIADNTVRNAPIPNDCYGNVEVYGWNLLSVLDECTFTGTGSAGRGIVSPGSIGPLSSNGGPTPTYALLAGSEAIDTTTAQGCVDDSLAALATDQRGAPRIAGLRCDVGAFEYAAVVPAPDLIFRDGFDSHM